MSFKSVAHVCVNAQSLLPVARGLSAVTWLVKSRLGSF